MCRGFKLIIIFCIRLFQHFSLLRSVSNKLRGLPAITICSAVRQPSLNTMHSASSFVGKSGLDACQTTQTCHQQQQQLHQQYQYSPLDNAVVHHPLSTFSVLHPLATPNGISLNNLSTINFNLCLQMMLTQQAANATQQNQSCSMTSTSNFVDLHQHNNPLMFPVANLGPARGILSVNSQSAAVYAVPEQPNVASSITHHCCTSIAPSTTASNNILPLSSSASSFAMLAKSPTVTRISSYNSQETTSPLFLPFQQIQPSFNALIKTDVKRMLVQRAKKAKSEGKRICKSEECSKKSRNKSTAENERASSAGTILPPMKQQHTFQCAWRKCGKVFTTEEVFIKHINVHVCSETSPNFHCRWDTCMRKAPFAAAYLLAQHVRKHSGEKPYQCEYRLPDGMQCVKRYSRLENKKTHERTHNGERPYQCAHCTKTFTNASDKAKHQNRTHKQSKDFHCPVFKCTKQYTDPSSLRKHVCNEHGKGAWHFAKQNKEERAAKTYGVNLIGIDTNGTPYLLQQAELTFNNSDASSCDEDCEVDVVNTTPPPADNE